MSLREGCTAANAFCDAPEEALRDPGLGGCDVSGALAPAVPAAPFVCVLLLAAARRGRRRPSSVAAAVVLGLGLGSRPARADEARPGAPVPKNLLPTEARDESRLALSSMVGASLDRPAFFVSGGVRYRASERWLVGLDLEWNPWATLHAVSVRPGTLAAYGTVVHRIPMRSEKLWIRTAVHLGAATLLHDLVGARAGSTGPFVGLSLLGLEIDVGRGLHVVVDPADVCLVVPQLAGTPVVHRQYRLAFGLQFGGP